MKYTNHLVSTSQTEKTFDKASEQITNNAGGFVFKVNDEELLKRFITLGSESGTFYVTEKKLTVESATNVVRMIKENGPTVVKTVVELLSNRKVPKTNPGLFVLALAMTYGNEETKKLSYSAISTVAATSTQLFDLFNMTNDLRGWSRGLRNGFAKWYTSKTPNDLEYQLVKYRQRNGVTHRDVLRLSHPNDATKNELFKYAVGKSEEIKSGLIAAFETAQKTKTEKELVALIKDNRLTWEMIPTEMLNNKAVQMELIQTMPYIALLRNLSRFSRSGLLEGRTSEATKLVTTKILNEESVKRSKIHPVTILNALKNYSSGFGERNTWEVNPAVVDALSTAFENSFNNVEPIGKKILVAVDVSGSMQSEMSGYKMSAAEASAAMMMSYLVSEPNAEFQYFNTSLYPVKVGKRTSYEEVLRSARIGGGTDCSLPYVGAWKTNTVYDGIIVFTDNETYAGKQHVYEAFEAYRKAVNPNAKTVVVGVTSTEFTLFPSSEKNALGVSGFDASVPEVIKNFLNS